MRFSSTTTLLALAAATVSVSAYSNATWTTEVVTEYITYCPYATQITYGTNIYTVTEPTTLTISDCPCTVSKPVYTSSVVSCSTCSSATSVYPTAVPPTKTPITNGTASVRVSPISPVSPPAKTPTSSISGGSSGANATRSATTPPIATYTGAAAQVKMGAGIAGLIGMVAFLL